MQIIGEAARTLPEDVRTLAPEIPWPNIIGMRNILVHGYFDIDTDIVWEAAVRDVLGALWRQRVLPMDDAETLSSVPAGSRS